MCGEGGGRGGGESEKKAAITLEVRRIIFSYHFYNSMLSTLCSEDETPTNSAEGPQLKKIQRV